MKNSLLSTLVLLLALGMANAQVLAPAASPASTINQTVGITDITVEYSRPGVKGRTVFGDLVPFDKVWRLGANQATKITFSKDVKVGGKELKKGAYAVLAKPGASSWSFMFYPYTSGNWSGYLSSDVEPVVAQASSTNTGFTVENFMIQFDELTNSGANLYFIWDQTAVVLPIEVETDKDVQASIDKVMAGPSAGDYFSAATYYASEGKNLDQALEWIDKSIEMGNAQFWVFRAKSLIQAKLGDKSGAIETAKKSLSLAKDAGNDDYIKMNEESIKEWMM